MDKKIKIAVIGSCVTRDIFNSKFNKEYKDIYECVSTAWQTSIISFMSDRTWIEDNQKGFKDTLTEHQRNTANRDISKEYKNEFIEAQPDFIIFDLYTDVRYGVVKNKSGYLTNNPNGFRKTVYYQNKQYEEALNIYKDEKYLTLLYKSFAEFEEWVRRNIPKCKILITGFIAAFSHTTKENYIANFDLKTCNMVARDNIMYNKIYLGLSSKFDVILLDMQNKTYFGDHNHIYGVKPWHLTQHYYDDLYKNLNNVVLEQSINNVGMSRDWSKTLFQKFKK